MELPPFKQGVRASLPIVLGYLPVSMTLGVLARKAGLGTGEICFMSLFVYAGASQFVAVEMISMGAAWIPIVLTTFFVNLRHSLMGATLSLHFNRYPLLTLGLLSAQLTDETFAVAMSDPSKIVDRPSYLVGLQAASQLAWIAGTLAGALFGGLIDHGAYGLPFALPGLFICLLVLQINSTPHLWIMVIAGCSSLLFKAVFPGNWNIVFSTLLALGIGVVSGTGRSEVRGDVRERDEN